MILIVGFTVAEIVALSPSSVDDDSHPDTSPIDPTELVGSTDPVLATGIPRRIPEYSVTEFDYVSTQDGEKQWKLLADKAALFNKEHLVHARQIKAFLFDPEGKVTIITGKEAKYFMGRKDLEVFGDVVTKFPDGFELYSEYLRYHPDRRYIEIPNSYPVRGLSRKEDAQVSPKSSSGGSDDEESPDMSFTSHGFQFEMARGWIVLPRDSIVSMIRPDPKDNTTIDSDHCEIDRRKHIAHFTMFPERPVDERFVHIHQPTLYARSRRADVYYGDASQILHDMTAYDDVFIRQLPGEATTAAPKPTPMPTPISQTTNSSASGSGSGDPDLKYATGGRADFDTKKNLIVLTQFPQAYQGSDTVTGDVILMHRDTDVIEVEHSNSYTDGAAGN